MKKLFVIAFSILHFISYSQSHIEIDSKIDSLKLLIKNNLTDNEKLEIYSQIRKLRLTKYSRKPSKIILPNLDSINQNQSKLIMSLWQTSKSRNISKSLRDSIYATIFTYKEGKDLLIENIDYYHYDYDEISSDGLGHYPLVRFLYSQTSAIFLDYLNDKICDDNYKEKFIYLLHITKNSNIDENIYKMLISSYLQKPCIDSDRKETIEYYLKIIE